MQGGHVLVTGAGFAGGTPPGKLSSRVVGKQLEGRREDLDGGLCRGIKGPVSVVNGRARKRGHVWKKWGEWDTGDWVCNFSEERPLCMNPTIKHFLSRVTFPTM